MYEKIPTYLFEDDTRAIETISKIIEGSELLTLAGQASSPNSAIRLIDAASKNDKTLFLLDGTLISPNRMGEDGRRVRTHILKVGPKQGWEIFSISSRSIEGVKVQLGKAFEADTLDALVRTHFQRS